jgi:hypothetical protein
MVSVLILFQFIGQQDDMQWFSSVFASAPGCLVEVGGEYSLGSEVLKIFSPGRSPWGKIVVRPRQPAGYGLQLDVQSWLFVWYPL